MFIVVIRSNASDQNIADLIFARTTNYSWFTIYTTCKVMSGMIVADSDDGGTYLAQRVAKLRRERVSNQGNILATQLKARVAKPGYFHVLFNRFSHKFGRGLLSSPDFNCTTGISVLQGDSHISLQSVNYCQGDRKGAPLLYTHIAYYK